MRANPERRRQIADAAVAILARDGAHGLSHRAVDTDAGLPNGTTSNFFNSRPALLLAAAERLVEMHRDYVDALRAEAGGRLDREQLAAILHRLIRAADHDLRVRHLARFELFLAGVREPELQPALAEVRALALEASVVLLEAAGVAEPAQRVSLLSSLLSGLAFDQLTAGSGRPDDQELRATIEGMLDGVLGPAPEAVSRRSRRGAAAASTTR